MQQRATVLLLLIYEPEPDSGSKTSQLVHGRLTLLVIRTIISPQETDDLFDNSHKFIGLSLSDSNLTRDSFLH